MNPRLPDHDFAIASTEELWIAGVLVESRLSHGVSRKQGRSVVAASSADEELVAACREEIAALRRSVDDRARVRLVASARRSAGGVRRDGVVTMSVGGISIVGRDLDTLLRLASLQPVHDRQDLPIVWHGGSAAVLLHEAVGHASEHAAPAAAWPPWLSIHDEPQFPVDDCGIETRAVNLLEEGPASFRRECFRNLPLRRMSNLVVRQQGAPFDPPADHIDVHLVAGGSYDPLTDVVTVDISVSTAGPFRMQKTRAEIAASVAGATGEPLSYPGVICSREGQELAVGSSAPLMITR